MTKQYYWTSDEDSEFDHLYRSGTDDRNYNNIDGDDDDDEIAQFKERVLKRRIAKEKARQLYAEESDDEITTDARLKTTLAKTKILNEYDEARIRTQKRDKETLDMVDNVLKNCGKDVFYIGSNFENSPNVLRTTTFRRNSNNNRKLNETQRLAPVDGRLRENNSKYTARQRLQRVENHLDGILDYELPSASNFKMMRHSLREIHEKMNMHRLLLDRNQEVDLDADQSANVSDRINDKYLELTKRIPCLSPTFRSKNKSNVSLAFDPIFIPGYSTGLKISNTEQSAELRGRIRSLLCRTKRTTESVNEKMPFRSTSRLSKISPSSAV